MTSPTGSSRSEPRSPWLIARCSSFVSREASLVGRVTSDASRFTNDESRTTCGLTLIELLATIVLLSVSVVFIMQALARGAHSVRLAQQRLAAYTFLASKIAEVELDLQAGREELRPHGTFRMSGTPFHWQLGTLPVTDAPQLEEVTLTVGWRQGPHDHESHVSLLRQLPLPQP